MRKFLVLFFCSSATFCFGQKDTLAPNYFYNKGVEELKSGNYQISILSFTKAIKKNFFDVDAHYNRGVANYKMGNRDSACADWGRAFLLGDTNSKVLLNKHCDSLVILDGDTCRDLNTVSMFPRFKGGDRAMFEFLQHNIRYPEAARREEIQGKVYVQFVVTANGEADNVHIIRGIGGGCDEEAMRVVKLMQWEPATFCGKWIDVKYNLPINFTLMVHR